MAAKADSKRARGDEAHKSEHIEGLLSSISCPFNKKRVVVGGVFGCFISIFKQRAIDKSEEANKLLLEKRRRAAMMVAKRAGKTPNSRERPNVKRSSKS